MGLAFFVRNEYSFLAPMSTVRPYPRPRITSPAGAVVEPAPARRAARAGRTATTRGQAPGRADKREAILSAALTLFVERGFHGTTVPEVAEWATVGAGTIYRYFDSKEALVNALYQREKGAIAARMLTDFPADLGAREQFRALWGRMAAYVVENPLGFAFLELHNHASYLDATSRVLEARILAFGVNFVETAQQKGELRPGSPLLLIGLVLGAFVGLVSKAAQCGLTLDPAAWETAEQCMWEAVRI